MKQPEYKEGPEALESFKNLATAILQAPAKKKKKQTKKACFCKEAAEIRQGLERFLHRPRPCRRVMWRVTLAR